MYNKIIIIIITVLGGLIDTAFIRDFKTLSFIPTRRNRLLTGIESFGYYLFSTGHISVIVIILLVSESMKGK